jgi:hypothetical protein
MNHKMCNMDQSNTNQILYEKITKFVANYQNDNKL